MRWKTLMPAIWGISALVAVLLAVVLWLAPAQERLQTELLRARGEVPRHRSELPSLVGASYRDDLQRSLGDTAGLRAGFETELKKQALVVERWFSDVKMVEGVPARDEFVSAFRFQQDELRREIVGKAAARRRDLENLPLNTPAFVQNDQPPTLEEMKRVQREANLESLLLRCVGDAGAFPYRAVDFQEGWDAVAGDSPFRESSLTVHLSLPAGALHDTLRALCELRGAGPIVRIETLTTRPRALPNRMGPDDLPLIDADILLVLSSFRK